MNSINVKNVLFHFFGLFPAVTLTTFICASARPNYPGISLEQDSLAFLAIAYVNNMDWIDADAEMKRMMQLEKRMDLPPLSYLLMISVRVLRLQNDDFDTPAEKKQMFEEVNQLAKEGISLSQKSTYEDSVHATFLFIEGGIRGYRATLDIESDPINALFQGIIALKCLNTSILLSPVIKDAYLGSGLFNCILAKYPRFLRYVMGFYGKSSVNADTGLNHLRICAREALYSRAVAKQYLIQFLSPYSVNQAEEKRTLFRELENECPDNPYFLFLELDEALCFYPDSLHVPQNAARIRKRTLSIDKENVGFRRYYNLVKWQYGFFDSLPPFALTPHDIQSDRPFSYYPPFVDACRAKHDLYHEKELSNKIRNELIALIKVYKKNAMSLLKTSTMNALRKEFYLWHIREGCKIK